MTRTCKFGCPVLLGEWNENARKYHEAATGELHTRERCEEAKANARRTQGANNHNDHGNESYSPPVKPTEEKYVDHTLAKPSEVKIFFSQYPADVEKEYKEFQVGKKFAWTRAQYELGRDEDNKVLFTICFFYEEIKQ